MARLPARLREMLGLLLFCSALTGCQSIRLGSLLKAPPSEVVPTHTKNFQQASFVRAQSPDELPSVLPTQESKAGEVIDLETALRLAGAENPTIALAEEAVRARLAERTLARALLFPTLDVGANVRVHRGVLQTVTGKIIETDSQSLYFGFGANAVGSGTVMAPGLRLIGHLADAIYAPQAAQQKVVQSQFASLSTRNDILLDVGLRYLALVDAWGRQQAILQSLKELSEVARITANFSKSGQGRESDAQRAQSESLLVLAQVQRVQEDLDVAAAELARLLDLDPALRLRPADVVPPLLELVDRQFPLEALLADALANHPEISALSAEVQYQQLRLRQEKVRPWLPLVAVGLSAGEYAGGSNIATRRFSNFTARTDLDVVAVWSLQNMGLGNHAVRNVARTEWEAAQLDLLRTVDRVRREVAEAFSLTRSRRLEMEFAQKRAATAHRAYQEDMTRIRNLKGRPIEVLTSLNQLAAARIDLVRAMIGFSQAQLQLFVALGNRPIPAATSSLPATKAAP